MSIKDKNILFISPRFFNYEIEVLLKLKELGANVYYIDDRFDNGILVKGLLRLGLGKKFLKNKILNYFVNSLKQSNFSKVDYVFALTPEAFSEDIIKKYKELLPDARFLLYMWDSFQNRKNTKNIIDLFDAKFSFDVSDCKEYNLIYLPLFFIDDYSHITQTGKFDYDLTFIGTAHSDRYYLVKKIKNQLLGYKFFEYYYFQNILLLLYNKLTNRRFYKVRFKDITYTPLEKKALLHIIEKSKTIIDIQHPKQEGLTIRLIEMIGAKRKVITTNKNVKNFDFYCSNNILVIDRDFPLIDPSFLEQDYQELPIEIYNKYSINTWLNTIFLN